MKGIFITFEGLDGTGKTTQIRELEKKLAQENLPYRRTREPGGTPLAEKIRELILDPQYTEMAYETEALLYAASRAQHVTRVIKPALEEGQIVISDRFFDSSLAYQAYARGLPTEDIESINHFAMQGVNPDLTFLLDISTSGAEDRMNKRELDRLELEKEDFKKKVRQAFLTIAEKEKDRIVVIDASLGIAEIHQKIWQTSQLLLKEKGMIK